MRRKMKTGSRCESPFDRFSTIVQAELFLFGALLRARVSLCSADGIFEALAGGECRHATCSDLQRLARLRIASGARFALTNYKAAEWNQLHLVAVFQGGRDLIEDEVYDFTRLPLRKFVLIGYGVDDIGFGHAFNAPLWNVAAKRRQRDSAVPLVREEGDTLAPGLLLLPECGKTAAQRGKGANCYR